jgi:hypothetical protein
MTLKAQEDQNLEDLRLGLLATLHEYRGFPHIKKLFEDAISNVQRPEYKIEISAIPKA